MTRLPQLFLCARLKDAPKIPGPKPVYVATLPCPNCREDIVIPEQLVPAMTAQPGLRRRLCCGPCADRAMVEYLKALKRESPEQFKRVMENMERFGKERPL
jgi:hypothetical protein